MAALLPAARVAAAPATGATKAIAKAGVSGAEYTPRFLNKVHTIDATFTPIVKQGGIKEVAKRFVKSKPARVSAVVAAGAAAGGVMYDDVVELLSSDDPEVANIAKQALAKLNELRDAADVEEYPEADGKIGQYEAVDLAAVQGLLHESEENLKLAIAATGSLTRLQGLMRFLNTDQDLQAITIEGYKRG